MIAVANQDNPYLAFMQSIEEAINATSTLLDNSTDPFEQGLLQGILGQLITITAHFGGDGGPQ